MTRYLVILTGLFDFKGRTSRGEYWRFYVINIIILPLVTLLDVQLGQLFVLVVLVPSIALSVRRLHDIGKSGWNVLIGLVPVINLLFLVWMLKAGDEGANAYGARPIDVRSSSTHHPPVAQMRSSTVDAGTCPACGAEIPLDAPECLNCGLVVGPAIKEDAFIS